MEIFRSIVGNGIIVCCSYLSDCVVMQKIYTKIISILKPLQPLYIQGFSILQNVQKHAKSYAVDTNLTHDNRSKFLSFKSEVSIHLYKWVLYFSYRGIVIK